MKKIFARTATIDHNTHETWIDGVPLPWYMAVPGPEVKKHDEVPILELTFTILVDGAVTLLVEDGRKVWDPVLGDVGDHARRQVREEMRAAFPWLEIPEPVAFVRASP